MGKKNHSYFYRFQPYYSVFQKIFSVRQAFEEENVKLRIEMPTKSLKSIKTKWHFSL